MNDARHSAPGRRASLTRGAGSRGASTAVTNPVARRVQVLIPQVVDDAVVVPVRQKVLGDVLTVLEERRFVDDPCPAVVAVPATRWRRGLRARGSLRAKEQPGGAEEEMIRTHPITHQINVRAWFSTSHGVMIERPSLHSL